MLWGPLDVMVSGLKLVIAEIHLCLSTWVHCFLQWPNGPMPPSRWSHACIHRQDRQIMWVRWGYKTIDKAAVGWTSSVVSWLTKLLLLRASPTSQLLWGFIVSKFVQQIRTSCNHFWWFGALDNDQLNRKVAFYIQSFYFILSHQFLLVKLWQHCVAEQHWYTD